MSENLTLIGAIALDQKSLSELERRLNKINQRITSNTENSVRNVNRSFSRGEKRAAPAIHPQSVLNRNFKKKSEVQKSQLKHVEAISVVPIKQQTATSEKLNKNVSGFFQTLKSYIGKLTKVQEKNSEEKNPKKNPLTPSEDGKPSKKSKQSSLHHYFSSINQISSGGIPSSALLRAGIVGLIAYAAVKAVQVGYNAIKTDFGLYSQSAENGLSGGANKYLQSGLPGESGNQLANAFSQSSQFAGFNRFGKLNQIKTLVGTIVGFKNAGYLQKILQKNEDGVAFQKDVINSTLQQYQAGKFGKFGSPEAKNQANAILQNTFGGSFSDVIQSYGKGTRTKNLLDNIDNQDFLDKKTRLVSPDNALKAVELGSNINLQASNKFHAAVDKFETVVRKLSNPAQSWINRHPYHSPYQVGNT